jgi:hypothetical protein
MSVIISIFDGWMILGTFLNFLKRVLYDDDDDDDNIFFIIKFLKNKLKGFVKRFCELESFSIFIFLVLLGFFLVLFGFLQKKLNFINTNKNKV